MRDLEEIKKELKEIQSNFNPKKETYKIIDEIVNDSLNSEEVLEKLKLIKGTDKYPEDIKNKYIMLFSEVQELAFEERKKEEERVRNENTNELKSLIEKLEKTKTKNNEINQDSSLEEKEDLDDKDNVDELKSFEEDNDKISNKVIEEDVLEKDDRYKRVFLILLALVIISVVILILVFMFF
ncbi:MAG: hypothetical protein ACI31R_01650 [Bacilli bacterium]